MYILVASSPDQARGHGDKALYWCAIFQLVHVCCTSTENSQLHYSSTLVLISCANNLEKFTKDRLINYQPVRGEKFIGSLTF